MSITSNNVNYKTVEINELKNQKNILIHIPKTAGQSIYKLGIKTIGHQPVSKIRKGSNIFKITFVRNPYDRIVSSFYFLKESKQTNKCLLKAKSFKGFIKKLKNKDVRDKILKETYFIPQNKFIVSKDKIDFIGRYEKLNEDVKRLSSLINIKKDLTKNNSSIHKNFKYYYDEEIAEIVYEMYKKDFFMFNYNKDSFK